MMPRTKSEWLSAALVALIGILLIIVQLLATIGLQGLSEWPWFGEGGIAGLVIGLGTLAAAVYAGFQAAAAYKLNERTEVATRYQKASELLASDSSSASISGIYMMKEVALEAPEKYFMPALDVLIALAEDRTATIWNGFYGRVLASIIDRDTGLPLHDQDEIKEFNKTAWQDTPKAVSHALSVIGQLRAMPALRAIETEARQGRATTVRNVVLAATSFNDCDFSGMHFQDCMIDRTSFSSCSFAGAKIEAAQRYDVKFVDCNLQGATIEDDEPVMVHVAHAYFTDCDLRGAQLDYSSSSVRLNGCRVSEDGKISGYEMRFNAVFTSGGMPAIGQITTKPLLVFSVDEKGSYETPTKGGFRRYRPFPGQVGVDVRPADLR